MESGRVSSVAPQEMAHSAAAEEREGQLQEIEAVKRVCEDLRAKLRESERTVHELKAARQPEVEERRQLAESLKALEVKNSADIARHNALKEQLSCAEAQSAAAASEKEAADRKHADVVLGLERALGKLKESSEDEVGRLKQRVQELEHQNAELELMSSMAEEEIEQQMQLSERSASSAKARVDKLTASAQRRVSELKSPPCKILHLRVLTHVGFARSCECMR